MYEGKGYAEFKTDLAGGRERIFRADPQRARGVCKRYNILCAGIKKRERSAPSKNRKKRCGARVKRCDMTTQVSSISVAPADAGARLDVFLVSQFPARSRSFLQQLIEEEKVRVNGTPVKKTLSHETRRRYRGSYRRRKAGRPCARSYGAVSRDI